MIGVVIYAFVVGLLLGGLIAQAHYRGKYDALEQATNRLGRKLANMELAQSLAGAGKFAQAAEIFKRLEGAE